MTGTVNENTRCLSHNCEHGDGCPRHTVIWKRRPTDDNVTGNWCTAYMRAPVPVAPSFNEDAARRDALESGK